MEKKKGLAKMRKTTARLCLVLLYLAMLFIACGNDRDEGTDDIVSDTDSDSDSDTDSDSDSDTDTGTWNDWDTEQASDYWIDGFCIGDDQVIASDDCQDITWEGCCDENGSVIYCAPDNNLYCAPCATAGAPCGWGSYFGEYYCGYEGEDPSGDHPIDC